MTKLVEKICYKNLVGADSVRYFFKDCSRYFVVDYTFEAFDTHKPEAMAFIANEGGSIEDWDELAVSYKEEPTEACAECLTKMYKDGLISSLVIGNL